MNATSLLATRLPIVRTSREASVACASRDRWGTDSRAETCKSAKTRRFTTAMQMLIAAIFWAHLTARVTKVTKGTAKYAKILMNAILRMVTIVTILRIAETEMEHLFANVPPVTKVSLERTVQMSMNAT